MVWMLKNEVLLIWLNVQITTEDTGDNRNVAGETPISNLNIHRKLEAQLKYTICRWLAYEEAGNCINLIMPEQECVCACSCTKKNLEYSSYLPVHKILSNTDAVFLSLRGSRKKDKKQTNEFSDRNMKQTSFSPKRQQYFHGRVIRFIYCWVPYLLKLMSG